MKRFGLVLLTVLAVGSTGATATAAPPRARLRALVCVHALDPVARAVSVTAVMRPLPGTRKLALRFALLKKPRRGGLYTAIPGGDLSKWISPANPTLGQLPGDVWRFNKQVIDLAAPADYRFRVSFRWTGAHHRVLGTTVRVSTTCFQPERRPDLLVASPIVVRTIPSKPLLNQYVVTIRNDGATAAGPFDVQFAPGGSAPVKDHTVQRLGPGSSDQETFVGPACSAASPPTVTVDPSGQVDDYNRLNNSLPAVCAA